MLKEHIDANPARYRKGVNFDTTLSEMAKLLTTDPEQKDRISEQ